MSGEWIEWNGGDCPVSSETLVDVEYADGIKEYYVRAGLLDKDCAGQPDSWWKHQGHPSEHIVAYRIIPDSDQAAPPSA